jgi:hypothetical protein
MIADFERNGPKHNREADEQGWVVLAKSIASRVVGIHAQGNSKKKVAPARQLLAVSSDALHEMQI